MPKPQKVQAVEELSQRFRSSSAIYFVEYKGLTVAEISVLRRRLKEKKAELKVAKNTLTRIALEHAELGKVDILTGPTGLITTQDDPILPLKVVTEFAKEKTALITKGGLLDGKFFDRAQVAALSKVPPKKELLAQVLGSLQAPLVGLIWALQGVGANLVYTLQAISSKQSA
jgi:large subunit ribosomal protein L10